MTGDKPLDRTTMYAFSRLATRIGVAAGMATGLGAAIVYPGPASAAVSAAQCGELWQRGQFGPWDYRVNRDKLPVVENNHFNARVEMLLGGMTGSIAGDLDYTLRAFPNHHRALISLMRLAEREKRDRFRDLHWAVECYFERAVRFKPDDTVARMLYAQYLAGNARKPEAVIQLALAVKEGADNPLTQYNAGLLYLELKEYELALQQAHRAIALGMTRPGLADGLKAAGQWREPAATASAEQPAAGTRGAD